MTFPFPGLYTIMENYRQDHTRQCTEFLWASLPVRWQWLKKPREGYCLWIHANKVLMSILSLSTLKRHWLPRSRGYEETMEVQTKKQKQQLIQPTVYWWLPACQIQDWTSTWIDAFNLGQNFELQVSSSINEDTKFQRDKNKTKSSFWLVQPGFDQGLYEAKVLDCIMVVAYEMLSLVYFAFKSYSKLMKSHI